MKYALSNRSRDPGMPGKFFFGNRTRPNTDSLLPSLKSNSVDQSLEGGDTIFSCGKSRGGKGVKLPRLINNTSLMNDCGEEDTLITIDQT